ncbi:MAG: universal stress protein, partial [Halobacteriaceae archaeon]
VLVGVGGSEDSYIAVKNAIHRAKQADDELTFAIFDHPDNDVEVATIRDFISNTLEEHDCDATIQEIEDNPASTLTQMAERGEYDQLTIGGGQKRPTGKLAVGEIAEFVILNANITVKLVR